MRDEFVANDSPVYIEILQIGLAAGEGRQAHPAPQPHPRRFALDEHGVFNEGRSANQTHSARAFGLGRSRQQLMNGSLVVVECKHHVEAAEGQTLQYFVNA